MAEIATSKRLPKKEFEDIINRAEKGDKSAVPRLREILRDQSPGSDGRWLAENYGSPPEWLRNQLLINIGDKQLAVKEAVRAKMRQLRLELEGPSPTALERLLAERAVVCWFNVYVYEHRLASMDGVTMEQSRHHQRKIDAAHKRFLSSLSTLARVRKLAIPNLLVAVGTNQQINLG